MTHLKFPQGRTYDLACLGRLAVDLYAEQFGARLEDALSMFHAGESLDVVADEYGVPFEELEDAVRIATRDAA